VKIRDAARRCAILETDEAYNMAQGNIDDFSKQCKSRYPRNVPVRKTGQKGNLSRLT
jgi:hypothetical protein